LEKKKYEKVGKYYMLLVIIIMLISSFIFLFSNFPFVLKHRIEKLISKNKIDKAVKLFKKSEDKNIDLNFSKLIKSGKYKEIYDFISKCFTEDIKIGKYISKEELFEIFLKTEKINNTSEILKIIEKLGTSYKIYFLENLIKLNKKDVALGILSNKNILKDILLKSYEDLRNIVFDIYYERKRIKEFINFFIEEKDIYENENLYIWLIKKLKEKGYYEKVKEFMMNIFKNEWDLDLHKIWIETCVCLNEQNNIMNYFYENIENIKKQKEISEILDFYYKKAVEFEEIGDYKTASIILEAFVNQDIKYRDALTRYQKLLVKLEFNNISDRKIGITKKIKENDLTQTSALSENINDKYEFIREIGQGGMGIVYEAMDKKLNRKVAIKKLKEELSINPREKKRFIDEAQNVANLNHPNIISIYDIVEEGKDVYIVFEFIDGKTVNEILSETNKINIKKSIYIIKEVCKALSYSHSKNIVHRDIKPSNIMIANPPVSPFDKGGIKEGFVKVMDFGIARELKDTLTRLTGMVDTSGTFSYMSPEQHLGKFYKSSDIYSLGITFYEMICGELPFKGPDFLAQKRELAYKSPKEIIKDLPQEIENIISKCLNNDLEKRYKSADELLTDLEKIKI